MSLFFLFSSLFGKIWKPPLKKVLCKNIEYIYIYIERERERERERIYTYNVDDVMQTNF